MGERVALINLGCPKNLVDSEVMLGHLGAEGFELTGDLDSADVVVVNTCGFLEASAQESVNTLLSAARRKKDGQVRAVVAVGCMTQRYGAEVANAMPEVDGFLGVGQGQELPDVVRRVLSGERVTQVTGPAAGFEGYGLRLQQTPHHTAYLKISEGCDRNCAFCVIPSIRGKMVSRPISDLVFEARQLAARGVRELILVGQDPTRYGVDLGGHQLVELLTELSRIEDLRWIRVMYLFPDRHAAAVLEAIATLPRLCRYVDMPLQHAAPEILRSMNRPGGDDEFLAMIETARALCPEMVVRSTFIVGFPGETREAYQRLAAFVHNAQLDWVGVFQYSKEEGSPAAAMSQQITAHARRDRYHRLMRIQRDVTRKRLRKSIGSQIEVLVEQVTGNAGVGRSMGQAPEIDGETHLDLTALPPSAPGDFVLAEITGSSEYDLTAKALRLLHRSPARTPELLQIGVKAR